MDHQLKKIPVTKIDAARRQLETAITLWFHNGDPVSIHTLVSAGHEILGDINRAVGGPPMLGDPSPHIRPKRYKEYRAITRKAANFFKHASRDPKATHFFSPTANQYHLLDACQTYRSLGHEERPLMRLFTVYLAIHEPSVFLPKFTDAIYKDALFEEVKRLSKPQFFSDLLPVFTRSASGIS